MLPGGPVHGGPRGMVRRRFGWWLLVAMLAAGCTTSHADERPGSDQTDIWFAQHMVPHLLQTSAILDLAGDQLTRPKLARLAGTINRQSHVHFRPQVAHVGLEAPWPAAPR
jgi:hypothetical protein